MARKYPKNWAVLAERIKSRAGWRCERCGHPHDPKSGHMLGVAHLDHRYGEQRFNLAALCQRCHLKYEHKWQWEQGYLFEHSEWLKPHLEGWCRYIIRKRRAALARLLTWATATGDEAMNLSDKMMARITEAADRYNAKVAAGGDEKALHAEFKAAVAKWLTEHGVEAGPKFVEIVVAGAIGAAHAKPGKEEAVA